MLKRCKKSRICDRCAGYICFSQERTSIFNLPVEYEPRQLEVENIDLKLGRFKIFAICLYRTGCLYAYDRIEK